ncbi:MAG: DUF2339 domain-containing protein [Xanthobacteraceae bacterium]|nr:DUF2339 domain-containing protein [Xanthobacteraceae bacterium]MCW5676519.1 DUF2339 domain-containing protein [Xanthobacteraceae bacterium]
MEWALLGLLVLALPVMAIIAFFKSLAQGGQLRNIDLRLREIEKRLGIEAQSPFVVAPRPPREPRASDAATPAPSVSEKPSAFGTPPAPAQAAAADVAFVRETPLPPRAPRPTPPTKPKSDTSFEEQFGTRWVVWVGGLALALGGIFLVKFSIEAGLIGPAARIFLGALLAAALIAAGEWMRRKENKSNVAGVPSAHIPSILTAAGTTVAYATVYSAYALYGFLSPPAAFIALGIVAVATLAAALLHGPLLAGLGLIGAYVTPALVSSEAPNYWALYIYLAVVTAAAFALARARLWRWLAISAVVFGVLWMLPGIDDFVRDALMPHTFHGVVGYALAAALIVSGLFYGPPADGKVDGISSGALIGYLLAVAFLVVARNHEAMALYAFAALCAATIAIAWRTEAAAAAVPGAAILAALVLAQWAVEIRVTSPLAAPGPLAGNIPELPRATFGSHLWLGGALAILFGASGFLAQERTKSALSSILWASAAVLAPIAIMAALYYRIAVWERSVPFAAVALLLGGIYAYATELLTRRAAKPGSASAAAIFATGSIISLALALTFALEKGWLTVSLALMTAGIAYVESKRPLPFLRWLAAAACVLVVARIAYEPRIAGSDLGTTPIFNWLLWGYGAPALSFWVAGWLLRKHKDDFPSRFADSLAILFTALFFSLQIRHYINGGNIYKDTAYFTEYAMHVIVFLAMTIGLERTHAVTKNIMHDIGAKILAALSALTIYGGLLLVQNPFFTGEPVVGGRYVNTLALGYLVPAILAGILAVVYQKTRDEKFRGAAAITSIVLAMAYLTLEVRTLYQGPVLDRFSISDEEQYTYSAVWLVFAVVLLLAGIFRKSQAVRLASAAVLLATIAKVFFIDLAGLTGVWRALSFIGLGVVLVGIGLLYQRLLFPKRTLPPATPPQTES